MRLPKGLVSKIPSGRISVRRRSFGTVQRDVGEKQVDDTNIAM